MNDLDRRGFIHVAAGMAALGVLPEFAPAAPVAADPVGIAVIGAGRQGRAVMSELQKLDAGRVAVVCDSAARRLATGLRRAPGAKGVEDYRAAIEDPGVTAVVVATPTATHPEIAEAAIDAGKAVYCESPLCNTIEGTRKLAAAAARATAPFAVGLQGRSNPVYKLARTFYRSDSVRNLVAMRAQDVRKTSWRTPVSDPARENAVNWRLDPAVSTGLAGEMGTHQFDVVDWYLGKTPVRVSGHGSIRLWDDGRSMPDTVQLELIYPDGATLQYMASLASSFEGRYEVFFGSNATIKLGWTHGWMFKEADAPTQGWEVYANRQQFHNDEGITLIADATKLASQGKLKDGIGLPYQPLYYSLADFLRSVIDGAPVACTVEDGMRSTIVGILAHQAVATEKPVDIDPALMQGA